MAYKEVLFFCFILVRYAVEGFCQKFQFLDFFQKKWTLDALQKCKVTHLFA